MAEKKSNVNTTKSVKEAPAKQYTQAQIDADIKKAGKDLEGEKKVEVLIPKYLKSRIGSVLPVGINGAVIHVPVGEKVKIPEPYKKIVEQSIEGLEL